ncbi:MAG: ParB/RepB/Spo0J family partition protein [Terriglobales bacterium]
MITANPVGDKTEVEKKDGAHDKLAEKRRALGRGLDSLLPGPRVVPATPALPPNARKTAAADFSSPEPSADGFSSPRTQPGAAQAPAEPRQPATAAPTPGGEPAWQLALDQIEPNPYQTRTEFEPKALEDLAASIQAQGVLQPIVVRPAVGRPQAEGADSPQRFILILGERRFRASKMAGNTVIPAIVKRVSEQQAAEMTLVENLQRQDLDCLDQAVAFAKLSTDFHLTQEEIGKRVGVSREQVSNYLRLLKLPPEVLTALRNKHLTYSHARLLLALRDDGQITEVARVAIAKKMSVALLEELVMGRELAAGAPEEQKPSGARWVDPNVRAAQRSLETVLGMRVRIRDRKGKGKITIEYGTLEDFDRVVTMLKGR